MGLLVAADPRKRLHATKLKQIKGNIANVRFSDRGASRSEGVGYKEGQI